MIYTFFDKKCAATHTGTRINSNSDSENQQLANELQEPIKKKFKKLKVYSSFKYNIWGADLEGMQLISRYTNAIQFLLCLIDIYSKNAWIVLLKDKKGITTTNTFPKNLDKSNSKPNKT